MEWSFSVFLACFAFLCLITLILNQRQSITGGKHRPPGPPGWPIIGNIFDLGNLPHQILYELKFKYGPVIWLRLGFTNTLVIQSAKAAEYLFKNHDVAFSDRKAPDALNARNYNKGSLALCRYGSGWRMLRRLVTLELTTGKKVIESVNIRRNCVDKMIRFIEEDAAAARSRGESGEIVLSRYVFVMTFNLIGNLVFSRDLIDPRSEEGSVFSDALDDVIKWSGKPNLADFFPFLKVFDPQRMRKNMEMALERSMNIVEKFMNERIEEGKSRKERETKDFLDSVLEFEGDGKGGGDDKMSTHNMIIIIMEIFFAGTETTSGTIDWIMVELFRNPQSMERVKEELNRVIGPKRNIEESDIDQLPYLRAVIKESMRLHPVIPFLLPRNTTEETKFMGYVIPKDTQVFINAWAIGRDAEVWEDPLSFNPERFLGSNIDYRGQNFELIPFGSGRRICVGMGLAHRVLHLIVGSLLHCFDWEFHPDAIIDMKEKLGITVKKLIPLKAIPKIKKMVEG
ncbi:iridoid oxidase-like [Euphorbia lathyris]|uniref:iridoid oxidase-like n=1 Tax=Euphorbia lathyris TaxID=212925 RepID=UPI0033143BA8